MGIFDFLKSKKIDNNSNISQTTKKNFSQLNYDNVTIQEMDSMFSKYDVDGIINVIKSKNSEKNRAYASSCLKAWFTPFNLKKVEVIKIYHFVKYQIPIEKSEEIKWDLGIIYDMIEENIKMGNLRVN